MARPAPGTVRRQPAHTAPRIGDRLDIAAAPGTAAPADTAAQRDIGVGPDIAARPGIGGRPAAHTGAERSGDPADRPAAPAAPSAAGTGTGDNPAPMRRRRSA